MSGSHEIVHIAMHDDFGSSLVRMLDVFPGEEENVHERVIKNMN